MRRADLILVSTVLCWVLAGCGSGGDANRDAAVAAEPTAAQGPSAEAATPIDACGLISPADITALLGVTVDGKPTGSSCLWENADNYESVSLEIGGPNTAVNGTLPPPEPGFPEVGTPGPDGMRFLGSGAVEFAAGGRSNMVQVAVLRLSGDEANSAAVDLARKVSAQL